jgi:hypothetical protein
VWTPRSTSRRASRQLLVNEGLPVVVLPDLGERYLYTALYPE